MTWGIIIIIAVILFVVLSKKEPPKSATASGREDKKERPHSLAPNSSSTASPVSSRKEAVDEGFKSAKWVIREAFDKVMQHVEVSDEKKEKMFTAFQSAHRSGDTRKEEQAVTTHLSGVAWRWMEYEKWAEVFKQRQEWPYMWELFETLSEPAKAMPGTVTDALSYFTMNELKAYLKERKIKAKPAPKTRAETEKAFIAGVTWEDFSPVIEKRYEEAEAERQERIDNDLCRLLAHTLSMTTYSLIHYYQGQELLQDNPQSWFWHVEGLDPIEKEFAKKFNQSEIKVMPPYFPGDRCDLVLKHRRR